MLCRMVWNPDGEDQELFVDIPPFRYEEFQELMDTEEWKESELVLWIPYSLSIQAVMTPGLFRVRYIHTLERYPV